MKRLVTKYVTIGLIVVIVCGLGYAIYAKRFSALTDSTNTVSATIGVKITEAGAAGLGYLSASYDDTYSDGDPSQDGYFLVKLSRPIVAEDSQTIKLTSLSYNSFLTNKIHSLPVSGGSDVIMPTLANGERLELIANIDAEGRVTLTQWSAGKPDDVTNKGLRTLDATTP